MDLYYGYKAARWVSVTLPRRFNYWLAMRVSWFFYALDTKGREAVRANLRQIFRARGTEANEALIRRCSRETFVNFAKYLVDFFRYAHLSPDDVGRVVEVDHPEYIRQAAGMGKGVIAVSAHFGNWEMGGAVIPALGYRFHAVVLPQRLEKLNRLFQSQRRRRGFDVSFLGQSASTLMRALRKGGFVGLLADLDFTGHQDTMNFFGKPARLPRGAAYLAHRMGVPILPGFVRRKPDDSMVLHVYPPILPSADLTQEAIQARICAIMEDVIGRYPSQWFVFRDFWGGTTGSVLASNGLGQPAWPAGSSSQRAVAGSEVATD